MIADEYELKDVVLEDVDDLEFVEYFAVSDDYKMIGYVAPKNCTFSLQSFLDLK